MSTDERLEKVEGQLARVRWFNRCFVALIVLSLTMCLVCMLLTGCIDKSKEKSDAASEPQIVESEMDVKPVLPEYEWDEARRLGESYLQSAKDQYSKGYVKQATETLQIVRKYLDYLTAKDHEELNALMDKIQIAVAKSSEKVTEQVEAAKEREEKEEEEIDQDKKRLEERDTVVDLLIALNANVECLTCLATEIRDCLQSIEASQHVLIYTKSTP